MHLKWYRILIIIDFLQNVTADDVFENTYDDDITELDKVDENTTNSRPKRSNLTQDYKDYRSGKS